jgi:hypothetical protein
LRETTVPRSPAPPWPPPPARALMTRPRETTSPLGGCATTTESRAAALGSTLPRRPPEGCCPPHCSHPVRHHSRHRSSGVLGLAPHRHVACTGEGASLPPPAANCNGELNTYARMQSKKHQGCLNTTLSNPTKSTNARKKLERKNKGKVKK